jgi:predicted porin
MHGWMVALAAALVVPEALAQASNPVTLYGRVYVTAESVEAKGGANPLPRRNRVEDQSSLLGVRGTENLGGGLTAFFQLETGFSPDDTSGTFARRNSAIGLRGAWGALSMGRWDTPFKQTQVGSVDPWGDLQIGDITGAAIRQGSFSQRATNMVQYVSPRMSGFIVRAMYGANEGRTAARNPSLHGAAITWSQGQASVSYAYEKHNDSIGQTATTGVDEEGHGISGQARFGPVKVSGQYGEYERTNATKQKSYQVGLQYYVGKHQFIATYSASKDGGAASAATQPACDLAAVGYRYNFSRRTMLITSYAKVDNERGSLCNFGSNTLSIAEGQDPQGFSLGVRHTF